MPYHRPRWICKLNTLLCVISLGLQTVINDCTREAVQCYVRSHNPESYLCLRLLRISHRMVIIFDRLRHYQLSLETKHIFIYPSISANALYCLEINTRTPYQLWKLRRHEYSKSFLMANIGTLKLLHCWLGLAWFHLCLNHKWLKRVTHINNRMLPKKTNINNCMLQVPFFFNLATTFDLSHDLYLFIYISIFYFLSLSLFLFICLFFQSEILYYLHPSKRWSHFSVNGGMVPGFHLCHDFEI